MKLCTRNVFKGKVVKVMKGEAMSHVQIEIAPGTVVTASITNEAVHELELRIGDSAYAVINPSNVMVGRD